ncbi:MAG: ABC transporter permease [Roseibium sp.]|uniref:ABC transporter permease n=1 Tax=Roseibium sp. TaxID=1936156 RepID=UPI003D9C3618
MLYLIFKRLVIGTITICAVSIIIFLGTKVLPGDAAQIRLGQEATPENLAALRARLGLDLPLWEQYLNWLFAFLQGDLGNSLAGDAPVSELIADRYKNTLFVSLLTAMIGVPISLAFGILAAMFPGSLYDRLLTLVTVSLVAAPEFFTATLLVLIFVFWLGVGNSVVIGSIEGLGFWELIKHFALPIGVMCLIIASQLVRMTRAAVLNVMSSPYIEMAILKGLSRQRIILRHALPNAVGPIVNLVALNLAYLVTGVIVVEIFFAYSGLATLIVQGVQTRDFVVVQAVGMIFCSAYVCLMLIADIAAIASNPRLRYSK